MTANDTSRSGKARGVLYEGDWLPLAGVAVAHAKTLLRDAGNIPYFADAWVNGCPVGVGHVLRHGDRLGFSQRFGFKGGGDLPAEAQAQALVRAYPELMEFAARVRALGLPADRSLDVMAGMVAVWAKERFGPPDAALIPFLADIVQRLQRIESVLGRGLVTEDQDRHALAGAQHVGGVSDGPQPPDRFRLLGKEYKGISRDQWLLLKALWPQRTAEIEDVMEQVYGTDFVQSQEALRSVARRLTECLGRQSCRVEVVVKKGYCTLEIFDEPRRVATDRKVTG